MEFITKIYINKCTGQKTLVIPKGINKLKVEKLPPMVKVKITIPKDYLNKVGEVKIK